MAGGDKQDIDDGRKAVTATEVAEVAGEGVVVTLDIEPTRIGASDGSIGEVDADEFLPAKTCDSFEDEGALALFDAEFNDEARRYVDGLDE